MVELGDWYWKKEDTQHCIYPYVYVPVDWIPRFKAGHSRVTPVKKRQGLISRLSHCQPRARGVEESDRGFRWTVVKFRRYVIGQFHLFQGDIVRT